MQGHTTSKCSLGSKLIILDPQFQNKQKNSIMIGNMECYRSIQHSALNLGKPREKTPKWNSEEDAFFKSDNSQTTKKPLRIWKNLSVFGSVTSVVYNKRNRLGQIDHKGVSKSS